MDLTWLTELVSSLGEGAMSLLGSAGEGLAGLGGNLVSSAAQNPWGAIGGLAQAGGSIAPYVMGGSGMGDGGGMGGMGGGVGAQVQQPGGPTPEQLRRTIADKQGQGLSGASPDFLASMAGVTPQELDQLLGYRAGSQGAN